MGTGSLNQPTSFYGGPSQQQQLHQEWQQQKMGKENGGIGYMDATPGRKMGTNELADRDSQRKHTLADRDSQRKHERGLQFGATWSESWRGTRGTMERIYLQGKGSVQSEGASAEYSLAAMSTVGDTQLSTQLNHLKFEKELNCEQHHDTPRHIVEAQIVEAQSVSPNDTMTGHIAEAQVGYCDTYNWASPPPYNASQQSRQQAGGFPEAPVHYDQTGHGHAVAQQAGFLEGQQGTAAATDNAGLHLSGPWNDSKRAMLLGSRLQMVVELNLDSCTWGKSGLAVDKLLAETICPALQSAVQLKELHMDSNPGLGSNGLAKVLNAIENRGEPASQLKALSLRACALGPEGGTILCCFAEKGLLQKTERLNLEQNGFGSEKMEQMIPILVNHSPALLASLLTPVLNCEMTYRPPLKREIAKKLGNLHAVIEAIRKKEPGISETCKSLGYRGVSESVSCFDLLQHEFNEYDRSTGHVSESLVKNEDDRKAISLCGQEVGLMTPGEADMVGGNDIEKQGLFPGGAIDKLVLSGRIHTPETLPRVLQQVKQSPVAVLEAQGIIAAIPGPQQVEVMELLASTFFKQGSALNLVDLSHNAIGGLSEKVLKPLLGSGVSKLKLRDCGLNDNFVGMLCHGSSGKSDLRGGKSDWNLNLKYESLHLDRNNITDRGAHVLALALESSPWMKELSVGYNQLTAAGCATLLEALPSKMTALGLGGFDFSSGMESFLGCLRASPNLAKLDISLATWDSDSGHELGPAETLWALVSSESCLEELHLGDVDLCNPIPTYSAPPGASGLTQVLGISSALKELVVDNLDRECTAKVCCALGDGNFHGLRRLCLAECKGLGDRRASFGKVLSNCCHQLKTLNLMGSDLRNPETKLLNAEICDALVCHSNLEEFYCEGCKLGSVGLKALCQVAGAGGFKHLRELNAHDNGFTEEETLKLAGSLLEHAPLLASQLLGSWLTLVITKKEGVAPTAFRVAREKEEHLKQATHEVALFNVGREYSEDPFAFQESNNLFPWLENQIHPPQIHVGDDDEDGEDSEDSEEENYSKHVYCPVDVSAPRLPTAPDSSENQNNHEMVEELLRLVPAMSLGPELCSKLEKSGHTINPRLRVAGDSALPGDLSSALVGGLGQKDRLEADHGAEAQRSSVVDYEIGDVCVSVENLGGNVLRYSTGDGGTTFEAMAPKNGAGKCQHCLNAIAKGKVEPCMSHRI